MLNSILIRDFRTCKEVHIANIPKMLALVGKNGVGKSNVLQAIEWIAKLDVRQRIPTSAHFSQKP
jgi:recombinational DNA repair ATPase RecF